MKRIVNKDFVIYDYLTISVNKDQEQLYVDCYQNFGWEFINSTRNESNHDYYLNAPDINEMNLTNIKFRRDIKIKNKAELLILQKKMEAALKKIDKLIKEPEMKGTMYSIIIGIIGLLFFIFGILSYIASNPIYVLAILNGIVGLAGIIFAYIIYIKVKKQKQEQNEALIEEQYSFIYEYCEKANKLCD